MSKHLSKPDGTKMPMSAGSSNIEFLRKERLKREQSERERVEKLLNPDRNERHEAEPDFFNSQFNPDLIRESKKERKFKGREY